MCVCQLYRKSRKLHREPRDDNNGVNFGNWIEVVFLELYQGSQEFAFYSEMLRQEVDLVLEWVPGSYISVSAGIEHRCKGSRKEGEALIKIDFSILWNAKTWFVSHVAGEPVANISRAPNCSTSFQANDLTNITPVPCIRHQYLLQAENVS